MELIWILNFHGLGRPSVETDSTEAPYWLDADHFAGILDRLRGLEHVRITFDDGNRSDLEIAVPALARRGMSASFFVCAGRLEERGYLTGPDLTAMRSAGMGIGSHGWDHRKWVDLDTATATREWRGARDALEAAIGAQVTTAACPFGAYDRACLRGLRQAGFDAVYTSDGRPARHGDAVQARWTIRRDYTVEAIADRVRRPPGSIAYLGAVARRWWRARW